MKRARNISLLLLVAVGGFYVGRRYPTEDGKSSAMAPVADSTRFEAEIARLAAENRRLMAAREQRSDDVAAAQREQSSAASLARVNILRDLKKQQIIAVRVPVVYNNGILSDGFAQLFALTPGETETLRRAIEDARAEIDRLSLANANVTRKGDSTLVIVQPFVGGADVYDRLMDSFEHTLGPERYAAMVDLHTDELPRMFSEFGAENRTITITRDPANRFRIEDSRRTASGSVGRSTQFSDPSELSDFYRWLVPLLPPATRPP